MIKETIYKIVQIVPNFKKSIDRRIQIKRNIKRKKGDNRPNLILAITPVHGNMGDQFIAVAEQYWLHDFFPDYKIIEFPQSELEKDKNLELFRSVVKPSDIIFFHGGGNINDIYFKAENLRRKIIESCSENTLVSFQQSIHFGDSNASRAIKEKTSEIYNRHKKLYIFTREEKSFKIAQEMFSPDKVFLFPDMATYMLKKGLCLSKENNDNKICNVALCFRNDKEKFYSKKELENTISSLKGFYKFEYIDTHIVKNVYKTERYNEVKNLIEVFSKYDLIITDRFHGAIFSVFAGVPCIALKSTDHKIESGIKWFKNLDTVRYADSAGEIPELIEEIQNNYKKETIDFNDKFIEMAKLVSKITGLKLCL